MDPTKRHATAAQVSALVDFMQEHSELAKGLVSTGSERDDLEAKWKEITCTLNSMGGAIKSVDKWKQTWRDFKANNRKRALKHQQSAGDTGYSDLSGDSTHSESDYEPPKKKYAPFDEEIIRIERDKLELDKEYKFKKIEVLSRIATALEQLAKKD
ncbi:uncharacterized protein LOC115452319 [Manduca sexta]|uniref:uncharacterized protein LOC115452319 n=1 Tax=Manduca sexta TaxID=7130 RepID=UPI00188E9516|nr:uncharacterized protein LOC115452319 [Manduca sexta]